MAARDRFGGFAEPATTHLQRLIYNAVDPQNFEPNLALDLEIADVINAKKGTAPREAAIAIVSHTNNRNANVALLALTLLDICVKNCGYPFHLQISTKEFLNELVRRFPERPPLRYTRVQSKILELIEEWRQTICQTSKYKEDLGFIRDMHRLLAYKGYMFPEVKKEDAAVLNPSDNLRSAEEMEEEERAAQSAKLQELIRRGTPHDLQEANKLMKVMAGYDNRHKTDYRAKAAEEVSKVQQKARLLEEMLQSYQPGGEDINGEAWQELGNALASAQPKIQKMCEEESDDTEAVAKLFEINDSIHRTLERYRLMKKGDIDGASKIPRGTLGTSGAGVRKGPDNELSLIDFGPQDQAASSTATGQGSSLENDLLSLSMQDSSGTAQQSISLPSNTPAHPTKSKSELLSLFDTPSQATGLAPLAPSNQTGLQPQSLHIASSVTAPPVPAARQSSPFQFSHNVQPSQSSGTSLVNVGTFNSSSAPIPATSSAVQNNGTSAGDDEWAFSSALPNEREIVVLNAKININFRIQKLDGKANAIAIKSTISNNTSTPVRDLTFQMAVMKGCTVKMNPQSGRNLNTREQSGIWQTIEVHGADFDHGQSVKARWKVSYWVGNEQLNDQGDIASLGLK